MPRKEIEFLSSSKVYLFCVFPPHGKFLNHLELVWQCQHFEQMIKKMITKVEFHLLNQMATFYYLVGQGL
jgi:hypothetical protein